RVPAARAHDPTASGAAREAALARRIDALRRASIDRDLERDGHAIERRMLAPRTSEALAALDARDALFRSRVTMARHGFGRGEYQYFGYPPPRAVDALRNALFPHLAPIASRWHAQMRIDARVPV
ncbi:2OG-Fe(II) oxygenase, partial [Burkholderia pseudomallei]|uniref:2OG-Fe(II) oxygenase n=1 Tax=Burkholderia pseudomallei TaxID=28450 RepID=UPI0020CA85E0